MFTNLSVDPITGYVHVLWWEGSLYYSFWNASVWSVPETLSLTATAPQTLDLVIDSNSVLHAAVEDNSGGAYQVFHLSNDGSWSIIDNLSGGLTGDNQQPCLTVTPDDVIHVFWVNSNTNTIYRSSLQQ